MNLARLVFLSGAALICVGSLLACRHDSQDAETEQLRRQLANTQRQVDELKRRSGEAQPNSAASVPQAQQPPAVAPVQPGGPSPELARLADDYNAAFADAEEYEVEEEKQFRAMTEAGNQGEPGVESAAGGEVKKLLEALSQAVDRACALRSSLNSQPNASQFYHWGRQINAGILEREPILRKMGGDPLRLADRL